MHPASDLSLYHNHFFLFWNTIDLMIYTIIPFHYLVLFVNISAQITYFLIEFQFISLPIHWEYNPYIRQVIRCKT